MIVNSSYLVMLPTRLLLEPQETWSFLTVARDIPRKQFGMIWSISITSWWSRSLSRAKMRTSPQTLSIMLCLLVLAWWVARKSSPHWWYHHNWSGSSTYKGSKVEWDHDECAGPLEQPLQPRKENLPPKKKQEPLMNRFQLLNMDGSEGSVSDDEDIDTSGITLPAGIVAWAYPGPGNHWAPTFLFDYILQSAL